ncbi:GGDEF domain-containing protein [Ureibacillus xyleni]|nr:diguanylate cyclase [Ureibacillus xyleni]
MKFKGRITTITLVLITNCLYISYYFIRDGYIEVFEFFGLPIVLILAWWYGKQYDKLKHLEEKEQLKSKELQNSNKLFKALFDNAPIGIALIDKDGRPLLANNKLQHMLGYTEDELCAKTFNDFSHPDDSVENMNLLKDLLDGKIDHYVLEKRYFHKNGQVIWGSVTSALYPNLLNDSTYVIGMVDDITERKQAEQKLNEAYQTLQYLSNQDGLTGIANRRYFDQCLQNEFSQEIPLSIIMVDIDYFKQYNDSYGHLEGDECLKLVAKTFEKTIDPSNDLVARFGGEEFIILLPNTDMEKASVIAKKLQVAVENLQIPHIGSPIHNYLTVSIGISTKEKNSTIDSLLLEADQALYQAKQNSRNRIEMYCNP